MPGRNLRHRRTRYDAHVGGRHPSTSIALSAWSADRATIWLLRRAVVRNRCSQHRRAPTTAGWRPQPAARAADRFHQQFVPWKATTEWPADGIAACAAASGGGGEHRRCRRVDSIEHPAPGTNLVLGKRRSQCSEDRSEPRAILVRGMIGTPAPSGRTQLPCGHRGQSRRCTIGSPAKKVAACPMSPARPREPVTTVGAQPASRCARAR